MDAMNDKNQHWGSTLEAFLKEEGIHESAKAEAVTRVITWQTKINVIDLANRFIGRVKPSPCNLPPRAIALVREEFHGEWNYTLHLR